MWSIDSIFFLGTLITFGSCGDETFGATIISIEILLPISQWDSNEHFQSDSLYVASIHSSPVWFDSILC